MDEIHFAPPHRPWKDDSPVNANKLYGFNYVFQVVRNGSCPSTVLGVFSLVHLCLDTGTLTFCQRIWVFHYYSLLAGEQKATESWFGFIRQMTRSLMRTSRCWSPSCCQKPRRGPPDEMRAGIWVDFCWGNQTKWG